MVAECQMKDGDGDVKDYSVLSLLVKSWSLRKTAIDKKPRLLNHNDMYLINSDFVKRIWPDSYEIPLIKVWILTTSEWVFDGCIFEHLSLDIVYTDGWEHVYTMNFIDTHTYTAFWIVVTLNEYE